jgi:glycosyltransferase involved in cell wall biosynthesis
MPSFQDLRNEVTLWCPQTETWFEHTLGAWGCGCQVSPQSEVISVITAVKDREFQFNQALKSLNNQDASYFNENKILIEHVVQDAGGVPTRFQKIEQLSHFHTVYSRKHDGGLYPAFNIGYDLSSGNYITYLNSDDTYATNFLSKSHEVISATGGDWTFGNIVIDFGLGKSVYLEGKVSYFLSPWSNFSRFHHNTVLAKREIFEVIGTFPEVLLGRRMLFCSDYWWFMTAQRNGFVGVYIPSIIGYMKWGGASSSDAKLIYDEASFVAKNVYPEKKFIIGLIWKLRLIDNRYLSRYHLKIFSKLRTAGRRVYSYMIRVTHHSSEGIGRADERVN